ncbi:MAG: amidohydrolase family protein [Terriglobales bacterium]
MRRRTWAGVRAAWALALLAALALGAAGAGLTRPGTVWVRCGRLIYDARQAPLAPATVIITDGKVAAVGRDLPAPAGAERIDLSRYTVLPGLIDAHTHLWTGARGQHPSDALAALRARKAVEYALRSGVVAMRILGSQGFIDVALHDAIEEGDFPGPHIIPAGHAISIPGGHGDFLTFGPQFGMADFYTPLNGFVNSPADAEKAVHLQIKYGALVIKMMPSGGVMSPLDSPDAEQLSPEEMRVIVEEAHMAHRKVAAHDENRQAIADALAAGVDSIEHGAGLDATQAAFMRAHGVFLVPTLYIPHAILDNAAQEHLPDYMVRKARALIASQIAGFHAALAAGVKIAAGSDQRYEPGKGTVLDEIGAEAKEGMTARQALISATIGGAELLGLPQLGTVAVGQEGDLVAVEGDPLTDAAVVKNVRAVILRGQVVVAPR